MAAGEAAPRRRPLADAVGAGRVVTTLRGEKICAIIPLELFASRILAALVDEELRGILGDDMQPRLWMAAAFCLVAAGSLCVVAAPSAVAAQKPAAVEKSGVGGKKQTAVASKKKKTAAKKPKSKVAAKHEPVTNPEPRTPTDKQDCIAVAQAFYVEAGAISRRMKQSIPQGFIRVISKLNELCGEEEFDQARTSIDWMDTCLQDFAGDQKTGFCSTNDSLVCAVDPRSKACVASGRVAEQ